jgi:hypothetical protein
MEIFSAAEWQTMQIAFCSLLPEIAIADGTIDKKEKKALETILNNASNFSNDLARELLISVQGVSCNLINFLQQDTYDVWEALTITCELLSKKVENEIAYSFKRTLLSIGYYIASASGHVFQDKVSDNEIDVIMKYLYFLKLKLEDITGENDVRNISEFTISGSLA